MISECVLSDFEKGNYNDADVKALINHVRRLQQTNEILMDDIDSMTATAGVLAALGKAFETHYLKSFNFIPIDLCICGKIPGSDDWQPTKAKHLLKLLQPNRNNL